MAAGHMISFICLFVPLVGRCAACAHHHPIALSMILKLTPAGEQAIWSWVCSVAKNADALNRQVWLAAAHKQVNLSGNDFDGRYRIWISGAESESGHLQALVLQHGWFRVLPKPQHAPTGGLMMV
ncbi:hypothetical protein ACFQU0_15670 [Hydrogenophaga defluvii]|uniref:Uncharacterized protein n=3 Tax=Hydrogenophaga TaxID=47420 RepID=A0ABW2SEE4_9BURK